MPQDEGKEISRDQILYGVQSFFPHVSLGGKINEYRQKGVFGPGSNYVGKTMFFGDFLLVAL